MLVMSRIGHAAMSLNRSEPATMSGQNTPKNRCRTNSRSFMNLVVDGEIVIVGVGQR
jgi:hypothetical protein